MRHPLSRAHQGFSATASLAHAALWFTLAHTFWNPLNGTYPDRDISADIGGTLFGLISLQILLLIKSFNTCCSTDAEAQARPSREDRCCIGSLQGFDTIASASFMAAIATAELALGSDQNVLRLSQNNQSNMLAWMLTGYITTVLKEATFVGISDNYCQPSGILASIAAFLSGCISIALLANTQTDLASQANPDIYIPDTNAYYYKHNPYPKDFTADDIRNSALAVSTGIAASLHIITAILQYVSACHRSEETVTRNRDAVAAIPAHRRQYSQQLLNYLRRMEARLPSFAQRIAAAGELTAAEQTTLDTFNGIISLDTINVPVRLMPLSHGRNPAYYDISQIEQIHGFASGNFLDPSNRQPRTHDSIRPAEELVVQLEAFIEKITSQPVAARRVDEMDIELGGGDMAAEFSSDNESDDSSEHQQGGQGAISNDDDDEADIPPGLEF
jgi:hypothetical protein